MPSPDSSREPAARHRARRTPRCAPPERAEVIISGAAPYALTVKTPEDWLFAALLRMVLEHCARPEGTLDSWAINENTQAMLLLAEAGFISIDSDADGRIRAKVLPEAHAFLAWMEQDGPSE